MTNPLPLIEQHQSPTCQRQSCGHGCLGDEALRETSPRSCVEMAEDDYGR